MSICMLLRILCLFSLIVVFCKLSMCFFFFKQKTAYEMRISDWSSDVCSSDLRQDLARRLGIERRGRLVAEQDGGLRRQRASDADALLLPAGQIGRASCRERVCQYV